MHGAIRRVAAIAALAFRDAVRSRLAASAALAAGGAILAVRRATSGTGATAAHNFTFYSLAAVEAVLFVAALASSAAAVSGEARAKTLQLTRAKPVPMLQFLLGRWIGLCATFALVLAAALAAIRISAPAGAPDECFDRVTPSLPPVEALADEAVANARASGVTERRELRAARREALLRLPFATVAIGPDDELNLDFPMPRPVEGGRPLRLEVAFASDAYSSAPLSAVCTLRRSGEAGNAGAAEEHSQGAETVIQVTNITSRLLALPFDSKPFAGAGAVHLTMRRGQAAGMAPLMLQPRQALAILVPSCGAGINFARAFFLIMPVVSLLLAAGLALGALFSLPVALFAAAGLVISVFAAGYAAADPEFMAPDDDAPAHFIHRATHAGSVAVVECLGFIAATATGPSPAAMLSDSLAIPPREAASSVAWNGLAIPLALLLAASVFLERKELP